MGMPSRDIWTMVDVRFVFSNIRSPELRKNLPNRGQGAISNKKGEKIDKEGVADRKKNPLFYQHKIRAPKYEYY